MSLIWVLYLDIAIRWLPPSSMDVGKFIMELATNLSPLQDERSSVSHRGAPLHSGDGLGASGILKDDHR